MNLGFSPTEYASEKKNNHMEGDKDIDFALKWLEKNENKINSLIFWNTYELFQNCLIILNF